MQTFNSFNDLVTAQNGSSLQSQMSVFNAATEEVKQLGKEIDDAIRNTLSAREKAYELYNIGKGVMLRSDVYAGAGDHITWQKLEQLFKASVGKPTFPYHS